MSEKRFIFNASAMALGGQIGRPFHEALETQASTVLPPVGGRATASVANYHYNDLISFRRGSSTVHGNIEDGPNGRVYNTLSTVSVEGLNIADLITADQVVARLVSERQENETEQRILPIGSYFVNLRVLGIPIDLQHAQIWNSSGDAKMLLNPDEETHSEIRDGRTLPVGAEKNRKASEPFLDRYQVYSLYDTTAIPKGLELERSHESSLQNRRLPAAWCLYLPGFGRVFFGEMIVTRDSRRLSMIRIEMGSPCKGSVVLAVTEGNGSTYP
ncbi:MAG: choice-of-anchor P family protein [Acidobacteriota bacterium]